MSSKNPLVTLALGLAASSGGLAIGWMDTHNDEASVTVAALLVLRSLVGCIDRSGTRRAWLWALLIGVWVPVLSYVLPPLGFAPVNPGLPRTVPSYLALAAFVFVACIAGGYAGAWAGRGIRRVRGSNHI